MDESKRKIVLNAIISVCEYKDWILYAAHVRTNHVHVVLRSDISIEKTMMTLKTYSSRHLNSRLNEKNCLKYWSRHGSTRYISSSQSLFLLMEYVIDRQGKRMTCYYQEWYNNYKNIGDFD